jgi:hypothetical protein
MDNNYNNFSPLHQLFLTTATTFHHPPLFTRQFSPLHQQFTTAQTFHQLKHLYTRENTSGKFKNRKTKATATGVQ